MFEQQEYIKKLEQSVTYLEDKIKKAKMDTKSMSKEIANLKDSNENHIFINEKLNKALKRAESRCETLSTRVKQLTDESVVMPKKIAAEKSMTVEEAQDFEPDVELPFDGDMSSIMIKADQIGDFNLADPEEI